MDDLVEAASAREEVLRANRSSTNLIVSYKKESETCSIIQAPTREESRESDLEDSSTMGAEDSDMKDDSNAVLLQQDMKKSQMQMLFPTVYTFFSSYRSSNPDKKVTPFAMVLLIVLFLIYVLNQADRLVLAVTIPAGLRCELKSSECGASNESTNSTRFLDNINYNEISDVDNDQTLHNFFEDYGNSSANNQSQDCIHFSDSEQGLLTGTSACGSIQKLIILDQSHVTF